MTVLLRPTFLAAIALLAAAAGLPQIAAAQQKNFPTKPVRIVTAGPGSQGDILSRIIGGKLGEIWGQPVVIENRTGAGGAVGAITVSKAAPDGYTLLLQSSQFAIGAALHKNLPYDAVKDFAGVSQIGFSTTVLIVPASLGVKSLRDFISYAQARPGKILFSSAGGGSGAHMNGERFRLAADIKAVHVGMKSSPEAVIEVVTGRVHYSMTALGPPLPFIKDGRVLALAVANPKRLPQFPDVPTMAEVIPGYERDGSYMLLAPARTPRPVLNLIGKDVARVLQLPDVNERFQAMGFVAAPSSPEELDRILRADIATFTKVGKAAGLIAK